jgi:ketosteroid isomerase-like protein
MRRLFQAIAERDLEPAIESSHPDVVIAEPRSLPYGGDHRGTDGVRQHAIGWFTAFGPEFELAAPRFVEDDGHVVVTWRLRAPARNGESLDMPMVGVYRVQDGLLRSARMFYADTAEVLRFLEREGAPG